MFEQVFTKLERIVEISSSREETWGALTLQGIVDENGNPSYFIELYEVFDSLGFGGCITINIEGEDIDWRHVNDELISNASWKLNINKLPFAKVCKEECHTFFYFIEDFTKWTNNADPFDQEHPFNGKKYHIEVKDLNKSFGGPNFVVSSTEQKLPEINLADYQENRIREINHIFGDHISVLPSKHLVSFGELNGFSKPFYRNAIKCMALALCDEIYDEKIVLRGVRRIEQKREWDNNIKIDLKHYHDSLLSAIKWVYSKDSRFDLRHKLLLDRITLDIEVPGKIYSGLFHLINNALEQAKERYNFAIYERASGYNKELRDLLKDIRSLSDSYSSKVRSILSNFSRDILGGFLTVGISIYLKYSDVIKSNNNILRYTLYAYGIYFLLSLLTQSVVDWNDLNSSEKEFDYWKKNSREYLTNEEFLQHKNETFGKRRRHTVWLYGGIAVLYIIAAFFCFFALSIWNRFINV